MVTWPIKTLNLSPCYAIWVFNWWFDNLYSFLHPAKHGFPFILKIVLFKDINDTEIPITFSKKMIWKNQCLAIFCIWGWNVPCKIKDRRKFSFFSNRKSVRLRMRSWSENKREEGRGKTFDGNNSSYGDFCLWVGFLVSSWYMMTSFSGSYISLLSNARKIRLWALNRLVSKFRYKGLFSQPKLDAPGQGARRHACRRQILLFQSSVITSWLAYHSLWPLKKYSSGTQGRSCIFLYPRVNISGRLSSQPWYHRRQTATPETPCHTLFANSVGLLLRPTELWTLGPFIREKTSRGLDKTRTPLINGTKSTFTAFSIRGLSWPGSLYLYK